MTKVKQHNLNNLLEKLKSDKIRISFSDSNTIELENELTRIFVEFYNVGDKNLEVESLELSKLEMRINNFSVHNLTLESAYQTIINELKITELLGNKPKFEIGQKVKIKAIENYTENAEHYSARTYSDEYLRNTVFKVTDYNIWTTDDVNEIIFNYYHYELFDTVTNKQLDLMLDEWALNKL